MGSGILVSLLLGTFLGNPGREKRLKLLLPRPIMTEIFFIYHFPLAFSSLSTTYGTYGRSNRKGAWRTDGEERTHYARRGGNFLSRHSNAYFIIPTEIGSHADSAHIKISSLGEPK